MNNNVLISLRNVSVFAKKKQLLSPVSFDVVPNTIHSLMGPSGVGKSTLLKCINRLTDLQPELRVEGEIWYRNKNILSPRTNVENIRKKIGMVFQAPVIFPGSIEKNVLFGIKRMAPEKKKDFPEILEMSLREAALWDEVKDRLKDRAHLLSVGQKQRLSIARVLALRPEIILLDEPTSALDPRSTELIENLFVSLKKAHTLILVTHDKSQTEGICDSCIEFTWENGVGKMNEIQAACGTSCEEPTLTLAPKLETI